MKNAIVMMFDSLQFNYLGCYGNTWIKTPNMDRLAKEGVLFENCYTEGLPTIPCRRAMHTGRYTVHHSGWCPLTMEDTTIADLCWGRPIDTAIIFDAPPYRLPKFGYTRGFDKVWFTHGSELDQYYYEHDPLIHLDPRDFYNKSVLDNTEKNLGIALLENSLLETSCYLAQMQYWKGPEDRYVARTMNKAIEYLEQVDRNKQFFLWIDSFDPHEPWGPPSTYMGFPCPYDPDYQGAPEILPMMGDVNIVYNESELNHIRMLYAELVTLCDEYLGKLLTRLRELGFEENTLFLMVSDHGEPMGNAEHGHGIMRKLRPWPYEELTHTPMILRAPGIKAGQRIKSFVQSCDVAPTVCDWLGIGVHPDMQGASLLALCTGEKEKLRDYAIAGYYKGGICLLTEDWSYIHWSTSVKNSMEFSKDLVKNSFSEETFAKMVQTDFEELEGDVEARMKAAATVDGADQWTCTPGAQFIMPEEDELYDRKNDPFQLKNIAVNHPLVAKAMLQQLKEIMSGLKAS